VGTLSEWLYAEVSLAGGASVPLDPDPEERAIYLVEGEVEIAGEAFEIGF
jgi:redox-sensitive bicupin YhaK (pirin superfamily)